jgi:hypothetical protein
MFFLNITYFTREGVLYFSITINHLGFNNMDCHHLFSSAGGFTCSHVKKGQKHFFSNSQIHDSPYELISKKKTYNLEEKVLHYLIIINETYMS